MLKTYVFNEKRFFIGVSETYDSLSAIIHFPKIIFMFQFCKSSVYYLNLSQAHH